MRKKHAHGKMADTVKVQNAPVKDIPRAKKGMEMEAACKNTKHVRWFAVCERVCGVRG
jgi:hypothetical protein